jgi:hypothetical protein
MDSSAIPTKIPRVTRLYRGRGERCGEGYSHLQRYRGGVLLQGRYSLESYRDSLFLSQVQGFFLSLYITPRYGG